MLLCHEWYGAIALGSQLQGPWFIPDLRISHVLSVSMWISNGFVLPPKNKPIGNSKLLLGMIVDICLWLVPSIPVMASRIHYDPEAPENFYEEMHEDF